MRFFHTAPGAYSGIHSREGGMPKDTDAEIQRLLDSVKGKIMHEVETALLLAQKVGYI